MARQPNFLFFITDQQRAGWLGCSGHPVLKTPHIDAIAASGARFSGFHVASPVCMPNRASLLTGRYPTTHGLRYNGCTLPLRANTFVDVLAKSGYRTASIGKSHLQPMTGLKTDIDRQTGGPVREAWKDEAGDYGQEDPSRYGGERFDFDLPYYGYQHVDAVNDHGDRCGGHYGQWFRKNVPDWRALHDDANQLPHNYSCPQAYRTPVPEDAYPTFYIRDRAINYLRAAVEQDAPFFLFVSFPDPHHPFNPPGKYWDMYDPDDFKLELPFSAHRNPTPPMRHLHASWQAGEGPVTPQTVFMADDRAIREAMALTAGMMAMIDDAVGAVMAELDKAGLSDNTVVSYTSDHGDYLGDFNMLLKGAMPFRSVTQVPFIWSDPTVSAHGECGGLASTVDIAPTILARAGVEPYNGIQGRSLLPQIAGDGGGREALLVEYNDGLARLGFGGPARVRSLLCDGFRLTLYAGESWGELYDLKKDPGETHNLWDDPALGKKRADLTERLAHELAGLMDESPGARMRA